MNTLDDEGEETGAMSGVWLSLTKVATSGKVAGGTFIAAVLVAIGGAYLAVVEWKIPIPIAASGPILVLIAAAAWRFLITATLAKPWRNAMAVLFMAIVLLSTAAFLVILLTALWRYVSPEPPAQAAAGNLTLEEITSFLNDRSPETIAQYRDGARRHSYQMVSDDVPITGDAVTTASRRQAEYDFALADAGTGIVKITTLALAGDTAFVNGTSNRGHRKPDAAFEANVASYVVTARSERIALSSRPQGVARAWFVPETLRDPSNRYCQIAYYPGSHLFEVNGDTIWIETTSIAGTIKQLNFSLKGEYRTLDFKNAYAVLPQTPPQFARLPLDRVVPSSQESAEVSRCATLFKEISTGTGAQPWLAEAVKVWDAPAGKSVQYQVLNVVHDTLLVVEGAYTEAAK